MSNPVGRPPFEITEEIIKTVESYASLGMTQQQIADSLGIHIATLCDKKNEFVEFNEAIKRGKAKGIAFVANKLRENVANANVTAQIFYLKSQAGWKEAQVIEHGGKVEVESHFRDAESELNKIYSSIKDEK